MKSQLKASVVTAFIHYNHEYVQSIMYSVCIENASADADGLNLKIFFCLFRNTFLLQTFEKPPQENFAL